MLKSDKSHQLKWLAKRLQGELVVPVGTKAAEAEKTAILGAAGLEHAAAGQITYIDDPAKLPQAEKSPAAALLVPLEVEKSKKAIIRLKNPRLAFAEALALFAPNVSPPLGVHAKAIVGKNVRLGKGVAIGANTVIEDDVEIADGAIIHPLVHIGQGAKIGPETVLWPHVAFGWGCEIGARGLLHAGAVVGADGFGFVREGARHLKIPQIGRVVIADDVEIGANTTIDRATTHITRIGRGTKIDDQVHIAHNVTIGEDCIIAGKVGISGSARIGDRVILAGQVGVADHITIGEDSIVLARAAVLSNLPASSVASGIPAYAHKEELRVEAATRKLPDLLREIRQLKRRIAALEEKSRDKTK